MRKCLLVVFLLTIIQKYSHSQYWQQEVDYRIDVSLNDEFHELDGFEKINYHNNSPDTLFFIWFHLWPNAYKNDQTAFSDQLLENGNSKFYFSGKEEKGFINRLDFKVDNIAAKFEDHPHYIDVVKVLLPAPLPPGQTITIATPFHVKLPYNFSRGGHDGQSYQVTQWYPKPAVYDAKGWHPMPYLDQGEFYSEFGSFDVNITVPANYVVAATGELQDQQELEWLKKRSTFNWTPVKEKVKLKGGGVQTKVQLFPPSAKETKTLEFKQDRIHDFAWFADKRFIVNQDTCTLPSGRIINVFTYYDQFNKFNWENSVGFVKDAVLHYSSLVGEYPYNTVSAVQGPESFGGGMEYPTITVISPGGKRKDLDLTIAHEVGHNWFYGILASNERDYPWMDEGINTYYENKYGSIKYGSPSPLERLKFEARAVNKKDQPISTPSEQFNVENYDLVAYYKTSEWMRYLESQMGTAAFNKAMQEYFRQWQFKHPQPEDFQKIFLETGTVNDSIFAFLHKPGLLPIKSSKKSGLSYYPTLHGYRPFIPVASIGYNEYDGLMAGLVISSFRLPVSRFQYFLSPMYAFGSKRITAIGLVSHSFFPNHLFQKIEIGISGSKFTMDKFVDDSGHKNYLGFRKFVPGVKFTWKEKNARSTAYHSLLFKTFFIREDQLRFFRDTIISGLDTSILNRYQTNPVDRTLYQLTFTIGNSRILYPYEGNLRVEKGEHFIRATFTGNYFFNYPKGGGLDVRLFAGKFFYTGSKTVAKRFQTDRYHLNMTGANGYEDYTYSDYFLGRNKFDGLPSQQIMMRDGGFKVRTDLLAEKIGKTDDWLIAANFNSSIPAGINPLNLLPIKIPVKIFLDIGTYAEAWKQDAGTDRFIYDAGLHFPLFRETLNIYLPVFYSEVYKNYIQSTLEKKHRWLRTVSFSFNFSSFNLRKNFRELNFLYE